MVTSRALLVSVLIVLVACTSAEDRAPVSSALSPPAPERVRPSPPDVAEAEIAGCTRGFDQRKEIARRRFLGTPWRLNFYRGTNKQPCLSIDWAEFGSLFPLSEKAPHLGIAELAATNPPTVGRSAYVLIGYHSDRVDRVTFTLDGKADVLRSIEPPAWTGLKAELFVHLVTGDRFDRDRSGILRGFDDDGTLVTRESLRRSRFFPKVEIGREATKA